MMELQMSRRTFLKTSLLGLTGLTIGYRLHPVYSGCNGPLSADVTIWLNIAEDNQVTIVVVKAEMGQGVATALPMIVAEELEADWQDIKVALKGEISPFFLGGMMGMTAGSTSIVSQFQPLREVGAAAKEMLITACAQRWQVDPKDLTAENSYVIHPIKGSISYGELAAAASQLPIPENPTLKDPSEFRIIGQPLPRLDMPDHVEGKSVFGIDVIVPDMLYAAVRQSPVFGGEVANFDSLTVAGTNAEAIVQIPGGVAVVAQSYWEAERAAQYLAIEFNNPVEMQGLSSEDISQQLTQDLMSPGVQVKVTGDPVAAMETAALKKEATYEVPLLAHATMEPMTCTAKVTSTSCEIWVPTQGARQVRGVAANTAGLDSSAVTVHPTYLGGGFGRKIENDYVIQAVLASKAVGRPVKVIWSREQDIRHDFYRPAFKARLSGGIDNNGKCVSWIAKNAGSPIMDFGSFDFMAVTGFADLLYDLPNMSAHYVKSNFGVPIGWWRSIGLSQNTFFVESFVDELAHAAGEDPLVFRKAHLTGSPRSLAVLDKVAEMANWGHPSVPGAAQGLAFATHAGSIVAQIAEVSVDAGGEVKVHKVYCAIDCGAVVNPDIVKAQMEGGIVFGLTAALHGEITLANGSVQQSNFHDYPLIMLKDAPVVETAIIISGAGLGGVGETGVPPTAPAVVNAIFAATGHRIRKLPISIEYNLLSDPVLALSGTSISEDKYNPTSITLGIGDTITWQNEKDLQHVFISFRVAVGCGAWGPETELLAPDNRYLYWSWYPVDSLTPGMTYEVRIRLQAGEGGPEDICDGYYLRPTLP